MKTITPPRISLGIAMLMMAAIAFAPAAKATAILTVPPGLNPGDQYRIVFVTSTTRDATSTDIADYNNFVNTAANAPGSLLAPLGATWSAIASTGGDAETNIGGPSSLPIYLLDGTLVANGTAVLFNPAIGPTILSAAIRITETGGDYAGGVWTGTDPGGVPGTPNAWLGSGSGLEEMGASGLTDYRWATINRDVPTDLLPLYGISGTLTVPGGVPEPGSFGLILVGALAIVGKLRLRRNSK
jgi:hypothetical protein